MKPATPGKPATPPGVRIAGTGIALPTGRLSNHDLAKLVDTNDPWITQRTGIKNRHVAQDGQTLLDLAADALRNALDDAKLSPAELDFVLVATITAPMTCPSTATRLVDAVGATPAGGMDLTAACSGFVYGLNVAASLINSGHYRNIAVVGAELLSRSLDFTDRRTCILFGDAAGAAILSASDNPDQGCLVQTMRSDGDHWDDLYLPTREEHVPENRDHFNGTLGTMQMNGREVFKFAVQQTEAIIQETLDTAGITAQDLAAILAHQSNARILDLTRKRLDLDDDKLPINIERYGNTSAASVPLLLHEMRRDDRLHEGDLVLFTAIGGGMCWASSLWKL